MRLLLIATVALLAALVAAGDISAWTFQPVPDEPTHWLATWPGVHGVLSVRADNQSTVANRFEISTLLPGHDRITGLAVCRDRTVGTGGDLLVYVTSYDEHRVWRYQLDGATGAVVGQLQMLSPREPRAVMTNGDDCDNICVSGSLDDERRVVQCYRVARALDDDAVTLNEWWVLVSNYQWARDTATDPTSVLPRPEALVRDPHATALESSPAGSLWVDTLSTGSLTRFALDSRTGAHFPSQLALPAGVLAQHLTWCADTLVVADADSLVTVAWSTTGVTDWVRLDGVHRLPSASDSLRVVAWRYALLSGFDRLALADNSAVRIERAFDRLDEAIAVGEVSASSTVSASSSPAPSASPSLMMSPSPSAIYEVPMPVEVPEKAADASSSSSSTHKAATKELWALTVLAVPCCCLLMMLVGSVLLARHRRQGRALQPMVMLYQASPDSLEDGWTDMYDSKQSSFVAVPRNDMNSPLCT